jgi:2-dehydropantoate 2-reductase
VKAHQTKSTVGTLKRLCDVRTVVVMLQNGVHHAERLEPFAIGATIVPACIWLTAERGGSTVHVRGDTRITVPDSREGRAFSQLLAGTWLAVEPVGDFEVELWRKLILNAIASLMVLAGRRAEIYRLPEIQALARGMALECAAVARADGVAMSDEVALAAAASLSALPGDMGSSILADRVNCRPLEWEARNGVIRRLGRRYGVDTPISDVIVPLLAAASEEAES